MPNPRINAASAKANAAKMKAEALKKAKANKVKSKKGAPKPPPTLKKGEVKPAAAVKNTKVYKKIKSTSTYKPKFEKMDEDLKMASPNKNKGELKREVKKTKTSGGSVKNVFKKGDKFASKQTKKTKQKGSKSAKEARLGVVKKKTKQTAKMSGKTGANEGGKYKSKTKFVKDGVKAKNKIKETVKDGVRSRKEVVKSGGEKLKVKTSSPMNMSGRSYDMEKAYDKNLTPKARLHYLENERHDAPGKMKGSPYHMNYKNSPMNITTDQESKLPSALVKEIKKKEGSATQMKGSPYHMSNELKYGGPVIDQMQTLSQASANKVLRHMKK